MTVPDPATGGTLHDAIARALERENQTDEKSFAWHYSDAEAVLAALKEHLAEHPAAIEELGWEFAGQIVANEYHPRYTPPGRICGELPAPPTPFEQALKYIALPTMGYNDTSVAPEVFAQENATEANARLALATCIRQARTALGWGPIGWGPASQDVGAECGPKFPS